jgi:hypothetical protein
VDRESQEAEDVYTEYIFKESEEYAKEATNENCSQESLLPCKRAMQSGWQMMENR